METNVIEIEKRLLSSMMLKNGAIIPLVTTIVNADDFSPATKRLVPNFKLCKTMPVLSEEKYARMIEGGKTRNYIEKRNYKKKYTIRTVYKVSNAEGYDNTDPLDLFDYSALSVCISNFDAGNQCITPAIIYRGLTGKITKNRCS